MAPKRFFVTINGVKARVFVNDSGNGMYACILANDEKHDYVNSFKAWGFTVSEKMEYNAIPLYANIKPTIEQDLMQKIWQEILKKGIENPD
jgi:hypothetical protein